ncbi:peroxisome assembly protein 26-like [Orbicella faveolata]|uniref:peroxisome assembly protein 26-like n=1 Tax=Orbicella faveolata TaxID=48498 RepID=UPI0009E56C53|nr:peroxisome assembly protein 26-like [Orbicella faveolata]
MCCGLSMNTTPRPLYDDSQLLFKAKSFLVLRRFREAVQVCCEVLELALKQNDDIKNSSRGRESSKDFAVIGIQAYAERNQCGEAVTFASQIFGSSEGFPAEVLEICIYMLLKASKYDEAAELAEKWLECEENFSLELKYCQIAGCYIKHILFPQGLFENIQRFLRRNQVLTPEQREILLHFARPRGKEKAESCASSVVNTSSKVTVPPRLQHGAAHGVILRVIAVLRKLQSLYSTISCQQKTKTLLRIVILFFFVYSFLTATGYQGLTKNSGISILWQGALNAWRALFSPYHLM